MAIKVDLTDDNRREFNAILDVLGLTQSAVANDDKVNVSQGWLSNVLRGKGTSVDGEMLERVAKFLIEKLKNRRPDNRMGLERTSAAIAFLSNYISDPTGVIPPKISHPGGPVAIDAANYIKRSADDYAMEALQEMPFTMLVEGPVHCGKSSLLARIQHKVQEVGIETAWFDPKEISGDTLGKTDTSATAISALYELLQAAWNLKPADSYDSPLHSMPLLIHWLQRSLRHTANKPRLLILDDLASLGTSIAAEWVSSFVRAIHNTNATMGFQISIAVGLTYQFGPSFYDKLLEISSIVHWWPKIQLGWLRSEEKVTELETIITGKPLAELETIAIGSSPNQKKENKLYHFLTGQPYLTHAALKDPDFRDAFSLWLDNQSKKNSDLLRKTRVYRQHSMAIKMALLGPAPRTENKSLLKAFIAACAGKSITNPDYLKFLEMAKLLDKTVKPTLGIYKLMAEDLAKLSER